MSRHSPYDTIKDLIIDRKCCFLFIMTSSCLFLPKTTRKQSPWQHRNRFGNKVPKLNNSGFPRTTHFVFTASRSTDIVVHSTFFRSAPTLYIYTKWGHSGIGGSRKKTEGVAGRTSRFLLIVRTKTNERNL